MWEPRRNKKDLWFKLRTIHRKCGTEKPLETVCLLSGQDFESSLISHVVGIGLIAFGAGARHDRRRLSNQFLVTHIFFYSFSITFSYTLTLNRCAMNNSTQRYILNACHQIAKNKSNNRFWSNLIWNNTFLCVCQIWIVRLKNVTLKQNSLRYYDENWK